MVQRDYQLGFDGVDEMMPRKGETKEAFEGRMAALDAEIERTITDEERELVEQSLARAPQLMQNLGYQLVNGRWRRG
jgi:ribosome assembly protein YihI (activator of Der GTPase)